MSIRPYYEDFRDWIELHARWSQLRTLGNSSLVRASILMPAFGYMLLLNDNVHQYLTLKFDGRLLEYLPSVWRIWFLFYGSFSLALATVLYAMLCAPQVKRYATPYEQAAAETDYVYRLGGIQALYRDLGGMYQSLSARESEIFTLTRMNLVVPTSVADYTPAISKALIHQWNILNLKMPLTRCIILALFAAGLFLVAFPALVTFIQVSLRAVGAV